MPFVAVSLASKDLRSHFPYLQDLPNFHFIPWLLFPPFMGTFRQHQPMHKLVVGEISHMINNGNEIQLISFK